MKDKAIISLLFITILSGCSFHVPDDDHPIVELSFSTFLSSEQFQSEIALPLSEKFPYIHLTPKFDTGRGLPPIHQDADIRHYMLGGSYGFYDFLPNTPFPAEDLTPLINNNIIPIQSIPDTLWNHAKLLSSDGTLQSLPYTRKLYGVFFNPVLLEQSNLSLPEGTITWGDIANLNAMLPYNQKPWFRIWIYYEMMNQLSIPMVRGEYNSEEVLQKIRVITDFYSQIAYGSQGYMFNDSNANPQGDMYMIPSGIYTLAAEATRRTPSKEILRNPKMNVATFPIFNEYPATSPMRVDEALQINKNSTHKEAAFEVVTYMLSKQFQLRNVENGLGAVIDDLEVTKQFGAKVPEMKGKNLDAFFTLGAATFPEHAQLLSQEIVEKADFDIRNVLQKQLIGNMNSEDAANQIFQIFKVFIR